MSLVLREKYGAPAEKGNTKFHRILDAAAGIRTLQDELTLAARMRTEAEGCHFEQ
jgi:hypothetical protein